MEEIIFSGFAGTFIWELKRSDGFFFGIPGKLQKNCWTHETDLHPRILVQISHWRELAESFPKRYRCVCLRSIFNLEPEILARLGRLGNRAGKTVEDSNFRSSFFYFFLFFAQFAQSAQSGIDLRLNNIHNIWCRLGKKWRRGRQRRKRAADWRCWRCSYWCSKKRLRKTDFSEVDSVESRRCWRCWRCWMTPVVYNGCVQRVDAKLMPSCLIVTIPNCDDS